MKRLVSVLIALTAGCGPQAGDENNQTVAIEDNLMANVQADAAAQEATRVQALIDRAMPTAISDAATARYRNVRAGVGGAACGEVAVAAANAPFRHFVITPDAVAVVGVGPGIKFNDPADFLADAWVRWCASPEEMKQIAAEIDRGPPPPSPDDFIPAPRNGMAVAPAVPPAPKPAEAPPTTQIDSFAASVRKAN